MMTRQRIGAVRETEIHGRLTPHSVHTRHLLAGGIEHLDDGGHARASRVSLTNALLQAEVIAASND